MQESDFSKFYDILGSLGIVFDHEISDRKAEIYFEQLKSWSLDDVAFAADRLSKTCRFFPKIVDFIEAIQGTEEDKASIAWSHLMAALHKPGPYQTVDLKDRYLHAAAMDCNLWGIGIDQNGYPDNKSEKEEAFTRMDFVKRYKYHRNHSDPACLPEKLTGIYEHVNTQKVALGEAENWTPVQKAIAESSKVIQYPALDRPERKKLS